jgi:broad specificity phosphatase PhoE
MDADPRPASITLVRHGESIANLLSPRKLEDVPPEWRGTPDHKIPLTDRGREQARETAAGLAAAHPEGFDFVYHSPYRRTRETAEELVRALPEALRDRALARMWADIFLREQAFGLADLIAAAPGGDERATQAYAHFEMHRASGGKFYTRPESGDSWADVCERTHTFLGKLFREEWRDRHVLVVSHAVTIATFRYHLERLSEDEVVDLYQKEKLVNCGASRFVHVPRGDGRHHWRLEYWNRKWSATSGV